MIFFLWLVLTEGHKPGIFETSLTYDQVFNDDHRVNGLFFYSISGNIPTISRLIILQLLPIEISVLQVVLPIPSGDKYFAEFNFGYNGSENFAPGKRFGFSLQVLWAI